MTDKKNLKNAANKDIVKMSDAASFIDKFVGDVSKKSATKQIIIGALSGW